MTDMTLKNLFFPSSGDDGEALPESGLVGLESDIKEQLPKIPFKSVQKEMGAKIAESLNVGIDEILIAGWKKYQGFQEYADPSKHPPEESILVPLAKHTIQSAHRPHVDLKIKGMDVASVVLEVEVAVTLEGVVLKVQGGKIRDVKAGSCQASGKLECSLKSKVGSKELLSLEKKTGKFQLKGTISLGDGIAIPAPAAS